MFVGPAMLSIGKLGRGAEGYYLQSVAAGVEDYYLGSGEATGYWVGRGSARLGLSGPVQAEDLQATLDGRDPRSRRSMLWIHRADRLPGFDLTFSAPKGVSLLFALSDPRTSLVVREAHDRAVAAALGYLEREAGEVRRGRDGVDRLPGGGFVAAAFRHRTSRAGDPQLHTHVLVANMTRGWDGRWSALDGRQLYLQAKTAGTLYQSALRHELRALGLRFILRDNGLCELADVPRRVLRAFSRRRVEIEAELARRGLSSREAAEVAALSTRKAKDYGVSAGSLSAQWHARAEAMGFDQNARTRLQARTSPLPPSREVLSRTRDDLLGPAGLTAKAAVFDRRDALRAWCGQLPSGAPVETVERLADQLLTEPDVLPVDRLAGWQTGPGAARSFARHATVEMLTAEAAVLDGSLALQNAGRAAVDNTAVDRELSAAAGLSDEQRRMVRGLTTSGRGVDVVVGKAGTGKTHALAAAARIWQQAGIPVLGTAVAARAAMALTDEAGIPATSVARLLANHRRDLRGGRAGALPAGAVLVVDEAGMLGTRDLAQLLEMTDQAGGKLVLVGDHRQLPELAAGGTFRALARDLPALALTENRRQVHAWERDALDHLRNGDVGVGLDACVAAGRVAVLEDREKQLAALVAAWWEATQGGEDPEQTVLLAHRRADVADLNLRVRSKLQQSGRLTGPEVYGTDEQENPRCFAAGDLIVVRRNVHHSGLLNGQRGRVSAVDPSSGSLTLDTGDREVAASRTQLLAGVLDHGYALTIHQAQGITVDRALLLGNASLYREAGYVGLSRARQRTDLILSDRPDDLTYTDADVDRPREAPTQTDPMHAITQALQRSKRQRTARDTTRR